MQHDHQNIILTNHSTSFDKTLVILYVVSVDQEIENSSASVTYSCCWRDSVLGSLSIQ